jgi:hypothetical protein
VPFKFRVRHDSGLDTNEATLIREARSMILEAMVGLSLVLNVSLDTDIPAAPSSASWLHMTAGQKDAALLPLVRMATDCIVRKVASDPRFSAAMRPDQVNNLIVDSIASCARPVRAMMDAHDSMYGKGSGEAFLLGPYLDVLPSAVVTQVKTPAP